MGASTTFFQALPAAATSPLALAAYFVAVTASFALALRLRRNQQLLRHLKELPPKDRRSALQEEMGVVLPKAITAEDWLRSRRQTFLFYAFAILCVCLTLVLILAFAGAGGSQEPTVPADRPTASPAPAPTLASPTATPSPSPQPTVDARHDPIRFSPARLDGRTIDACIRSANYEALGKQCSTSAQRLIASEFCALKGRGDAISWAYEDTGVRQNSYKLQRGTDANGAVVEAFVVDDGGGTIFGEIVCH